MISEKQGGKKMKAVVLTDNTKEQILKGKSQISQSAIIASISIIVGIVAFLFELYFIVIFAFVGAVWGLSKLQQSSDVIDIYSIGREGEKIVRQVLSENLSDDYTVFVGVPVRNGDIDCVVVGPTGVFAIEIKHHKGQIQYNGGGWRQIKIGHGGTAYFGSLKDPEKQLFTAMFDLKDYLKQKSVDVFIKGVVTFTHPETELFIEKQPENFEICKVDTLPEIIKNGKNKLSKNKISLIENAISSLKDNHA